MICLVPVSGQGTASNDLAKAIAELLCKNGIEDVDALPLAVDVLALTEKHIDIADTLLLTELDEAYANAELTIPEKFRLHDFRCKVAQLQTAKARAKNSYEECGQILKELRI